ncbi:MAG: hypothetical protein CMH74_00685 [Nitrospina sp.]|nr:hypothetical protein [Nitrospina sp.]
MQENIESEQPNGSEVPEEETSSEETTENSPTQSSSSYSKFEEHDGEVLPPENKKNSGCGVLIFIILLLTGGGGYLYYTDQVPAKAAKLIEPLLNKLNPLLTKVAPQLSPTKKPIPEIEKQSLPQAIEGKVPVPEKTIVTGITPSISKDQTKEHISGSQSEISKEKAIETIAAPSENQKEEHISGSQSETSTEIIEPDNMTNISGAATEVDHAEIKQAKGTQESKDLKATTLKEPAPIINPIGSARDIEKHSQNFKEEPVQQTETRRNKAVQAYLDFFEASLLKLGELVKTGFVKGKDLLQQFLNKN